MHTICFIVILFLLKALK